MAMLHPLTALFNGNGLTAAGIFATLAVETHPCPAIEREAMA
jgi:hypothetical protein